jgi:hypothetical protein
MIPLLSMPIDTTRGLSITENWSTLLQPIHSCRLYMWINIIHYITPLNTTEGLSTYNIKYCLTCHLMQLQAYPHRRMTATFFSVKGTGLFYWRFWFFVSQLRPETHHQSLFLFQKLQLFRESCWKVSHFIFSSLLTKKKHWANKTFTATTTQTDSQQLFDTKVLMQSHDQTHTYSPVLLAGAQNNYSYYLSDLTYTHFKSNYYNVHKKLLTYSLLAHSCNLMSAREIMSRQHGLLLLHLNSHHTSTDLRFYIQHIGSFCQLQQMFVNITLT